MTPNDIKKLLNEAFEVGFKAGVEHEAAAWKSLEIAKAEEEKFTRPAVRFK